MPQERQKLTIYTARGAETAQPAGEWKTPIAPQVVRRKLSPGERLLRNSAIACALLFAILSLRNIDHPWAQTAASTVEKALTVDFDVDETLGELQFVRRFLPESTLVFWNISGEDRLKKPVGGAMLHEYSDLQPWYTFVADSGDEVCAGKAGVLKAATQTSSGDWALEIEHPDGACTVYAYVDRGTIERGESVSAGEVLTTASLQGCVYLEYRSDGQPAEVEEFYP